MGLSRSLLPKNKPDWSHVIFTAPIPVDEVYADVILYECPTCKAEQGDFCHNPLTKNVSKIPCRKRLREAP